MSNFILSILSSTVAGVLTSYFTVYFIQKNKHDKNMSIKFPRVQTKNISFRVSFDKIIVLFLILVLTLAHSLFTFSENIHGLIFTTSSSAFLIITGLIIKIINYAKRPKS